MSFVENNSFFKKNSLTKLNEDIELSTPQQIPLLTPESILTKDEKWGIFLLHSLYFIQGIPFGFFALSIPILLIEAGTDFSDVGIMSFCLYPFCFKILLAPIEDIYFRKAFGKRKTYIVPAQYLLAIIFFLLSFSIENLIENKNVGILCGIGFIVVSANSFQDVAVDGWNLTLLRNEHLQWGAVSQTVGQSIGIIFGGSFLIQISSLINLPNFLRFFAIIIVCITIWVHFIIKERNPVYCEYSNVCVLVKDLKGFYRNKNLRLFVFFLISSSIGFSVIGNTAYLKLILQGYPKETITFISMIVVPINFTLSFLLGKYGKKGQEMTVYIKIYCALFVNNVFLYILILLFGNLQQDFFNFLFFIACLIGDGANALLSVNQGGFINRISDEDVGGTFLTFLNAAINLGRFGSRSLTFFMMDVFDYNVLVVGSWIYTGIYFILMWKNLLRLEKLEKEQWKLHSL